MEFLRWCVPPEDGVVGGVVRVVGDGHALQHLPTPGNVLVTTLWTES